ncbi:MAG TPA: AarF/UbiB family protein [Jatrophihabitans sp.]|jgi:ubiquinone biosynthesis protein
MTVLFILVLLPLFVFTVGRLCSRLLGVRLGFWHSIAVGVIGWVAGVAAAAAAIGRNTPDGRSLDLSGFDNWAAAFATAIFFGVLTSMPVAIVLDLLTRRATRPLGHHSFWLSPVRRVKGVLAPYGRMRQVVGLARQHGLLHLRFASRSALESPDLARRIKAVLEDSGGMLVKFGQVASTRGDILPPALIAELSSLRADVRPISDDEVRQVLEEELAGPYEDTFKSFDWEPLAAASIGQTHRAVLADGTRVVVKVQRPEVRDIVLRDAAVLRLVASQLERRVEAARIVGLTALCEELILGIEDELDYQHEANLGMRLREHRAGDVGIAVPKVYQQISTGRMLVMDEVDARSIADERAIEECAIGRHELAEHVLASFIGQVLEDGLFHADPHPGNLLVDPTGTIWLLDFGSVGRLDSLALSGLRGIALGFATNDASVLARAARDLAGNDTSVDLHALEADLAVPLADLDSAGGFDPAMVGHVLTIMQRHDLRPPGSITLLGRALVTLEGTLRVLEPGFSMVEASKDVVRTHRDAFGSPREMLQHEMVRLLPVLRTLPEHVEAIAGQMRAGALTVRTERFAGRDRDVVDEWVDRSVLALIGSAGTVSSALLLLAASATSDRKVQTALWILGFGSLAVAAILTFRGAARALRRHASRLD